MSDDDQILDSFLATPEGRGFMAEMAEDWLYYRKIMPDTTERTRRAMAVYMRGVMTQILGKDQN